MNGISPNTRFSKGAHIGCPYCSGVRLLQGFNDLSTTHPDVALQWHPTKNENTTPDQITKSSETRYWWKCSNNHEWQAGVYSRAVMNTGCPVCSGKKVDIGVTDLVTLNPILASQWHPMKNDGLLPKQVAAFSSRKVWWQCSKGHEWEAVIAGRHQGRNCARCTNGEKASKAEKELAEYVLSLGVNTELHTRKILQGKELDIYIPRKKIAIEYNGLYWHTEENGKFPSYHYDKWQDCKNLGIDLIQVWEDDWNRNPNAVRQFISYKLGFHRSGSKRSSNLVEEISCHNAHSFFMKNHPRGHITATHYLGMTFDGFLFAVLAFNTDRDGKTVDIIGFASLEQHSDCFETLLAYVYDKYKPEQYSVLDDHSYSEAALWEECGFSAYDDIPSDFSYLYKKARTPKNNLNEEDVEGLNRIWDAGKTLYVK